MSSCNLNLVMFMISLYSCFQGFLKGHTSRERTEKGKTTLETLEMEAALILLGDKTPQGFMFLKFCWRVLPKDSTIQPQEPGETEEEQKATSFPP